MLRIDAHHHLWRYDAREFAWLDDSMATLRRDFLVSDLEAELNKAHVTAAIAVQARQSLDETRFLLQCSRENQSICGVVGWMPIASEAIGASLDELASDKKLVGLREVVQGQADKFLEAEAFNRGMNQLTARDLTYDLLVYEHELEIAIRFVRRHPKQKFVLDHAAKPKIAAGQLEPWRSRLTELARCENIWCKLSGMVTEADWQRWDDKDVRPYLEACVEAFGTSRLMAGSDWPVCLVASEYARWWNVLDEYFASFSDQERQQVFGANALEFYGIGDIRP